MAKAIAAKKPRISKKVRKAIELLANGTYARQSDAAEKAGISKEHLCREIAKPHVRAYLDKRTHDVLAAGKARAGERLIELVDADSEHVSFDAARHVLAIAGIKPTESPTVVNNLNVMTGYVLDLSGAGPVIDDEPVTIEP